jgi:hypothetical protein
MEWAALWVILALAFALSFRALFDVGRAAGLGSLAWALPVIVDGFAILAARVIERLESRLARLYPWTLLIGLIGVSAWWNGLHAGGEVVLDPTVAAVVAGAPPVILGLAYHLMRMVTARQHTGHQSAWRADVGSGAPPGSLVAHPGTAGAVHANGSDGGDEVVVTVKQRAWAWYEAQRRAGHTPTAPQLAQAVDTSAGNARKLIALFNRNWQLSPEAIESATASGGQR